MSKKIKCALLTLALASVVTGSAALSACQVKTNHPQVKITVSFLDEEYEIEYRLYRNMYPQTVQHFIELSDEGFYDNTIIHNYEHGKEWFGGAYSYNEADIGNYATSSFSSYLFDNYKQDEYYALFNDGKLTPSVYSKYTYDNKNNTVVDEKYPLPTLIGEFSTNNHTIRKGELGTTFGVLKMFYYSKEDAEKEKVYVKNWENKTYIGDYKNNCATSMFSIQVGTGSSYGKTNYCVFGDLKNDKATEELNSLIDAISDYRDAESASKFETSGVETSIIDNYPEQGEIEVKYTLTSKPIIIKSVKVTKY